MIRISSLLLILALAGCAATQNAVDKPHKDFDYSAACHGDCGADPEGSQR